MHKAHEPDVVADLFDADFLASEDDAQINFASSKANAPAAGHGEGAVVQRVVRLSNAASFEAQVRPDLPLGTHRGEVDAYLAQLNITHVYVAPHHAYQAAISDIGMRQVFQASLEVWIVLDVNEKVRDYVSGPVPIVVS